MKRLSLSSSAVIHLFAAAHAAVAVVSRLINYVDDVPLTVLTIALIVVISIRRGLQTEMVAALTLAGCFTGYLIGSYGARLVALAVPDPTIAAAITTALVTELLGWSVYAFGRRIGPRPDGRIRWSPSTPQILALASAILVLRLAYTLIFSSSYFARVGIYPEFQRLLGNTFALMALLCGNVIFISLRPRLLERRELRSAVTMLFMASFTTAITLLVYYDFPWGNGMRFDTLLFLRLFVVILLFQMVVYTLFKLINYVIASNAELRTERGKKHRAQFQYNKLKLQINPHFLFNSLNILDFLVQEHQTDRASAFIRKLAGTYRYMLKNEDEPLVPLREEIEFAHKYIELLQERFESGFSVRFDVPPEALLRHVVPCCLQLLIENATKHNVVSPDRPLAVVVRTEGELLVVSNNLQPRLSAQASTGMGLKNIRQQYHDISGRTIEVTQTKTEFIVKLPLL